MPEPAIRQHNAANTGRDMSSKTRLSLPPGIVRYGAAVIGVALATVIRLLLNPSIGTLLPFTTYFITTILVAIYAGLGPALVTVVLGTALGAYLFVPPTNRFGILGTSGWLQIVPYFVFSICLSILI